MKVSTGEYEFLLVPDWLGSGPDHWQSHWQRSLASSRFLVGVDWSLPKKDDWIDKIILEVGRCLQPAVLVAHSVGAIAVVHAARRLAGGSVAGAFLVSPADVEHARRWPITEGQAWPGEGCSFMPIPRVPVPFPCIVISSTNDPYCSQSRARDFAASWQSGLESVGALGHITTSSGHGPWPNGLKLLSDFLEPLENRA